MTLPERTPPSGLAEVMLRECLTLDSRGGQLTVSGTCMEPVLKEGTLIQMERPRSTVRIGDVVLIRTVLGLRLHRVVFRVGQRLRTKGDNAMYLDPPGSARDVMAVWRPTESRVERALRVGLSVLSILRRPVPSINRPRLHPG